MASQLRAIKVISATKMKPEDLEPAVWDTLTCRDHSMYTFKYCNVHEIHLNRADENVKMISPLQMSGMCVWASWHSDLNGTSFQNPIAIRSKNKGGTDTTFLTLRNWANLISTRKFLCFTTNLNLNGVWCFDKPRATLEFHGNPYQKRTVDGYIKKKSWF